MWGSVAIVCATLLGPVLAVQAQKWLEGSRAIKERRRAIFRTLMTTRATPLAPVHVEALNAVPVEFYGTSKRLRDINEAWKLYLDHHDERLVMNEGWNQKRHDLFVDLLHSISRLLGYEFTKPQIGTEIYSPKAHGDLEAEHTSIRKGIVDLLNGEKALPMIVRGVAATELSPELQDAILKMVADASDKSSIVQDGHSSV